MIYFVRHGQTINNIKHIFYDQTAGPWLTDEGIAQAEIIAEELKDKKFDICYCSPRNRTIQTMKIITKYHPNLKIIYDDRITERCWGELANKPTYLCNPNRWFRYRQFPFEGIETVDEVLDRLKSFYNEINELNDKNILIVSHSGIFRVSYCYFYGFPKDNNLGNIKIRNGGFETFE